MTKPQTPLRAIIYGAIVVGSFDAAYAIAFWAALRGTAPIRIFQSIAGGLLGRDAFRGSIATAFLGVALHYGISLAIVAVYFLASRAWPALVRHPFVWGSVYGVGVYFFMNYAVIPLSATARPRFLASWVICSIVVRSAWSLHCSRARALDQALGPTPEEMEATCLNFSSLSW